jgi:hypothetical protein
MVAYNMLTSRMFAYILQVATHTHISTNGKQGKLWYMVCLDITGVGHYGVLFMGWMY